MSLPLPDPEVLDLLRRGVVIPASPLALDSNACLDERRQRAVYRYYAAAGAGGIAVGVHTTQFEIREPGIALFEPLLRLASEELRRLSHHHAHPLIKIAGVCGPTRQAVAEAELAAQLGFDAALLSLAALRDATEEQLLAHCRAVAGAIPLIGFYLQPAVGGRALPHSFWRRFVEIENVVAIKIAPFNRYQTLDVVRAVALAGRENDVTLYTGNDDNIIADLLTPYTVSTPRGVVTLRIRGGLLGQWSVWTHTFVRMLEQLHRIIEAGGDVPELWMRRNAELTDANAVVFDAANGFAGCIPGINEVLRRQGLLGSARCLDPALCLSPGQAAELDRIAREYPWLADDDFIARHREEWLREDSTDRRSGT